MARPKRRWLHALMFALVAVAFLALFIMFGPKGQHDKKDTRPSGPVSSFTPVATLEPSPGPLEATKAQSVDVTTPTCTDLLDLRVLAFNLQTPLNAETPKHSNSTRAVHADLYCIYDSPTRWGVAQATYEVLKPEGLELYRSTRSGNADTITVSTIPADQMPQGVDDGFFFQPTDMPADQRSYYHNPGVVLRLSNKTVTVSFKYFDALTTSVRQNYIDHAAKALVNQK